MDKAFLITPSPSPQQPQSGQVATRTTPATLPSVNRNLKPANVEELMDGKNNNNNIVSPRIYNNTAAPEGSPVKVPLGSKVNTWDNKDSSKTPDLQKNRQIPQMPEKVDNTPSIPSRSLKPRELLANLAAKKMEMEEEQELLEESMKVEEVISKCSL